MNSISECLKQISNLTKKNLQLLRMINDSFYTKKNHLVSIVDGEQYVIPSFLSLESKIDNIEANLQNILDAPKTGEAFTYFDGTTQKMELFGYSNTPPKVDLNIPSKFNIIATHPFKDFLSPQPSIRFDIGSISNNIKHANIRKVTIKNSDLLSLIQENVKDRIENNEEILLRGHIEYADLVKSIFNYENDVDYVSYDTTKRLPIRMDNPTGEYNIVEIVNNWQDSNFIEHYTLKLDKELVYYIQNGTIQRNIMIGDFLVTNNDKVELQVEDTNPVNKTITVQVMQGGYANLCDISSGNVAMYKLKYHKVNEEAFNATKYIEVPLEEDRYVCIFIAPINDTTNTQASFGTGVFLDTYSLTTEDDLQTFQNYYNENVNNIGDALSSITNMMTDDDQIEKLSGTDFRYLTSLKPIINTNDITVYQINKHLNDSESIQKIRNLYHQKVQYKNDLNDIQKQIDDINDILAGQAFDDAMESRESYKSQLNELNYQKRELMQNITSIVNEISENANSSDTPIENAKYHIRGFINTNINIDTAKVVGIDVEYRYRNKNKFTGNAETIGDNYIYSDWNKMNGFMNIKTPSYNSITGKYSYSWLPNNESVNEPSFNQIDIPISQGENVDIRVRYIYNLGWPLACMISEWSDIINIEFPEEFIKDIEVLDIISENNDDVKKNQFVGLLEKEGILRHIGDGIMDVDQEYFHQPEHIASGFFTEERRVIPLSDQLRSMTAIINDMQSEIGGAMAQLDITISDGIQETGLLPNIVNNFRVQSYTDAVNEGSYQVMEFDPSEGNDAIETMPAPVAVSNLILNIHNPTDYTIKLHSLFPGDSSTELDESLVSNKFDYTNYIGGGYCLNGNAPRSNNVDKMNEDPKYGVWMLLSGDSNNADTPILQRKNQFLYFRTRVDSNILYSAGIKTEEDTFNPDIDAVEDDKFNIKFPNNLISAHKNSIYELRGTDNDKLKYYEHDGTTYAAAASLYPYLGKIEDITAPAGGSFYELKSNESIQIPLNFVYWLSGDSSNTQNTRPYDNKVSRAIAFDIRTSLFTDPITYKLVVEAHYQDLQTYKKMVVNKESVRKQYTPTVVVNTNKAKAR